MNSLSAAGFSTTPVEGEKEAVARGATARQEAHPAWRERISVLLAGSLCAALVYLYWSA